MTVQKALPYHVARISLHPWEEPIISGNKGSGTVFFTGCRLHCVFCQNHVISQTHLGTAIQEAELLDYFFRLEEAGAHNINLVSASHYSARLAKTLEKARNRGLAIPVAWNSSGYDLVADLERLEGLIDIYLPDFKYYSNSLAERYSKVTHYRETVMAALAEMSRQQPRPVIADGLMRQGVLVRHLQLPGQYFDSRKIVRYLYDTYGNSIYMSLMSQYQPLYKATEYPALNRRLLPVEYEKLLDFAAGLGVTQAFTQDLSDESSEAGHTPDFMQNWRLSNGIVKEM